jgi:polar amino acid transport system permease protein
VFDLDRIISYMPDLVEGATETILLSVASIVLATAIGIVVAAVRTLRNRPISLAADTYLALIRNTPELVQLYFVYFTLPTWGINVSPFGAAAIVFGFHFGAFISEVFRGGIASIETSQWEAAKILGMGRITRWRVVILPQVVRRVLPAWGNYLLVIIKGTSLAGVITVGELFYRANRIALINFRYFEIWTLVALFYLIISLTGTILIRRAERAVAVQ